MISEKMQTVINSQINAELYSSYLYLSMASYFADNSLGGMAQWMEAQALEEQYHAMKMYKFVIERGGRVILTDIDGPPTEWKSTLEAFEAALAHEQMVTGRINKLIDLAIEESDHATNSFLQWFVDEQVEEEDSVGEVVDKLKLVEGAPGGLFMIDRELGGRTFAIPAGVTIIG